MTVVGWMAVALIVIGVLSMVAWAWMLVRHPDLMERDSYFRPRKKDHPE